MVDNIKNFRYHYVMTKYCAIVAGLTIDQNGEQFSPECLLSMAKTDIAGVNFLTYEDNEFVKQPIALTAISVKQDTLYVEFDTNKPITALYAVPGIQILATSLQEGVTVVEKCRLVNLVLTDSPVDMHLDKIKEINK